jgi:hypothetical protein
MLMHNPHLIHAFRNNPIKKIIHLHKLNCLKHDTNMT